MVQSCLPWLSHLGACSDEAVVGDDVGCAALAQHLPKQVERQLPLPGLLTGADEGAVSDHAALTPCAQHVLVDLHDLQGGTQTHRVGRRGHGALLSMCCRHVEVCLPHASSSSEQHPCRELNRWCCGAARPAGAAFTSAPCTQAVCAGNLAYVCVKRGRCKRRERCVCWWAAPSRAARPCCRR